MPSYLQELDRIKADLESRYPGWQVWYVPHSVDRGVTWCARPHPTINVDSPEHLAEAIEEAGLERDAAALARSTTCANSSSEQA